MESLDHWIGGQPKPSESGSYFDVLNPLDDSILLKAAEGTEADVDAACQSAHEAFLLTRSSGPGQRSGWLLAAADLLHEQQDELVEILIDEVGSPIVKAQREVASAEAILRAAAGATRQLSGKTLSTDVQGRLSMSVREPLGVIAGITPFNVPLIKAVKHSAMPLATGNTVVLLPSELAPSMACRLARIYDAAGVPVGAFNVVLGDGYRIGDHLTGHSLVRKVGFTGSSVVGRHIAERCGARGKRCTLELGGKNPLVVMPDADLKAAIGGGVIGAFMFQGQICMSASRIYVHEDVLEPMLQGLIEAATRLPMGSLRDPTTVLGPIISPRQREKVRSHIEDATSKGATIQCGAAWEGNRLKATILTGVTDAMRVAHEETFGPVTVVEQFTSADEVIRKANATSFGLTASVFTSDLDTAMSFSRQVRAGMVHINATTIQEEPHVPFGGIGDSGMGRESTDPEVESLTEWKWITINTISK